MSYSFPGPVIERDVGAAGVGRQVSISLRPARCDCRFRHSGPSYERSVSSPRTALPTGDASYCMSMEGIYGTLVDMRREDFMHPIIIAAKTQS